MRLAIFGDIHGNLPAFEAALADIRRQAPDALLCLGDVATDGAWPRACLQLLASLSCPVIRGNADEDLLFGGDFVPRGLPDELEIYEAGLWSRAQLTETDRTFIETFSALHDQDGVLAFHGSPASCREVIGVDTPDARLSALRTRYGQQPLWVGGHTHQPLLRTLDGWRLLNPGSVGLPFERRGETDVNPSYAEYLLLDDGGVTFRRVVYDVRPVQAGLRASSMPHAQRWAQDWVQG